MLEIIGTLTQSFDDFLKRDRYYRFLKEDTSNLHEMAIQNATKAIEFVKSEQFDLNYMREWISNYCKIYFDERNDTLAYSSINFPACDITIYVKRIADAMANLNIADSHKERFTNLFILHEFYHYLEFTKKDYFEEYHIPVFQWKKIKINRKIEALSEMSATAFMRLLVIDVKQYLEGGFYDEGKILVEE